MNKKILILGSVCGLFLFGVTSTLAVGANPIRKNSQIAIEDTTRKTIAKCDIVEKRIAQRVTNFDNQKNKHLSSYLKTRALIAKKIAKLNEKGYETTKLDQDLTEYDHKIEQFEKDYATYMNLLRETQAYACGQTEDSFRTKLAEARAQLKIVHQDAVAIRTFWAKTIRTDFNAIKNQKPKTVNETNKTNQGE